MLLAMTDLQANATGEHTSLSQMRSVLAELRRSFNAIQRNLRAAKKDPAWNFGGFPNRSALEERMRSELESRLLWHAEMLAALDAKIARWSAPQTDRTKRARGYQQDAFF